jgi:hypothetical protein
MATIFKSEIFRQEAPNFRSVDLYVEDNGDVKLSAQDMGQWVDEVWYDSDYEHWVTVQGIGAKRLLFTLLHDKFQSSVMRSLTSKHFAKPTMSFMSLIAGNHGL